MRSRALGLDTEGRLVLVDLHQFMAEELDGALLVSISQKISRPMPSNLSKLLLAAYMAVNVDVLCVVGEYSLESGVHDENAWAVEYHLRGHPAPRLHVYCVRYGVWMTRRGRKWVCHHAPRPCSGQKLGVIQAGGVEAGWMDELFCN